ncbi:hypothetical protein [Achromobacter deleyi]|uniref:hypothetical protein n=1 Tax=Achromobacter deleyi TaxID=1353891 RepID=UPI00149100C6|nr:hypothetical protein [Achromobacter deleyi]QVQ26453.1 hypothetical protein HLG70_27055 [Achromobacter deleyi]UIP22023.1 hypothetical protein LYZ39_05725 [Achromobacter deleyi]
MSIVNSLGMAAGSGQSATASRSGSDDGGFRAAFASATERGRSAMAGGVSGATQAAPSQAEQEFLDYASMSLEDKMFYAALASLGISKQQYDAMSAAERLEIAAKVSLVMQQLTKAENTQEVL